MLQESNVENITALRIAGLIIVIILSIIPFVKNYKFNDNHLNWLNHDYAKNLLVCTEQDSVFMTEGGDNQVFGSLYFTYAEKLRPDISPYDQKGNIFKRIYGDMRYIDPQTLTRRMNLVDTHLFASEEPFYEDIRDPKDPYFIPYWQGYRPVYLTWQRPEPWTLGDYYYKRYGIMYKVQNIEYALVDLLEIKKEISIEEARAQFSNWLHREVDLNYTLQKVNILEKEGLVAKSGNSIRFVKMYPQPHEGEYLNFLILRWKEAPNAMFWDNLTREIIMNYDYQMGEIYRERIGELKQILEREKRENIRARINEQIKDYWEKAKSYYEDALVYGGDSISMLHNISVVFLKNEMENLDDRVRGMLSRALDLYKNSWGTYSLAFSFLIQDSIKNPQNEEINIREAEKRLAQLKSELLHYRSSFVETNVTYKIFGFTFDRTIRNLDYRKHPVWKSFEGIEHFFMGLKQFPTAQLQSQIQLLNQQIKERPTMVDSALAQNVIITLYSRGIPIQHQPYITQADMLFNKVIELKKTDASFIMWAYNISLQIQKQDLAYKLGKDLQKLNANIQDPGFYYTMGVLAYNSGKTSEARGYLEAFLDKVKDKREVYIRYQELINNVQKILEQLKKSR